MNNVKSLKNVNFHSHQASNGSWYNIEESKSAAIQGQEFFQVGSRFDMGELYAIQYFAGKTSVRSVREKRFKTDTKHTQSHPLRRSAAILRNRADHLLEFVTDPMTGPAPVLHQSAGDTHLKSRISRLDALDASHIITSTAGSLSGPPRSTSKDLDTSVSHLQEVENSAPISPEENESEQDENEDGDNEFFDLENDDDTVKTRKGLVSLKSQPGGGRNLNLLRGLAAQSRQSSFSDDEEQRGRSQSIAGGMDLDDSGRGHSRSPRLRSVQGTSAPMLAGSYDIPDVPGTLPGQGSVLLARRATALTGYGQKENRRKARASSMLQLPIILSFADRPALLRTPETMIKFEKLSTVLDFQLGEDQLGSPYRDAYMEATSTASASMPKISKDEIEATPIIASLAGTPNQMQHDELASPSSAFPLVRSRSRVSSQTIEEPDLLWWQAVGSDVLAKSGIPQIPFASSSNAVQAPQQTKKCKVKQWQKGRGNVGDSASNQERREAAPIQAQTTIDKDLENLRTIKRLHRKIAMLKRDEEYYSHLEQYSSSEDEDALHQETEETLPCIERVVKYGQYRKREKGKERMSDYPAELFEGSLAHIEGAKAIQALSGIMLQHTGFDGRSQLQDKAI